MPETKHIETEIRNVFDELMQLAMAEGRVSELEYKLTDSS